MTIYTDLPLIQGCVPDEQWGPPMLFFFLNKHVPDKVIRHTKRLMTSENNLKITGIKIACEPAIVTHD